MFSSSACVSVSLSHWPLVALTPDPNFINIFVLEGRLSYLFIPAAFLTLRVFSVFSYFLHLHVFSASLSHWPLVALTPEPNFISS